MFEFSTLTPSYEQILAFLECSDNEFDKPLTSNLNIEDYARKLSENSLCVTCWCGESIVGMLNCYINRPPDGYISNVCVLGYYQGQGIFNEMFSLLCDECRIAGVEEIVLQVNKGNEKARKAYSKVGFVEKEDKGDSLYLIYRLPVVSVLCCVYNHEPYLRQCLDGFIMQDTTFKYEVIIHDDASTDSSADIIREYAEKYPDVIKPIYQKENQYSKQIDILKKYVCPRVRGCYVAICEGDDYWIDSYKLQKQVDYMETHPECAVCATEGYSLNQSTGEMAPLITMGLEEYTAKEMLLNNQLYTLSTLCRTTFFKEYYKYIQPLSYKFMMGDYPLWLYMLTRGTIHKFTDRCVVYRELEESASHSKNPYRYLKFAISSFDIRVYFNRLYDLGGKKMVFRKFRDTKRMCRHLAKKHNIKKWRMYIAGFYMAVVDAAPWPSKELKKVFKNIKHT